MNQPHIQRHIVSRLKNAYSLRYSELRPAEVDKDLFNYHLRELVKNGIIHKLPNKPGYQPSAKGQQRVADIIHTSDQSNRLFKVNPLLIVADRRKDGVHILSQQRTSWPSYGIVGVPGGTIVKGEPLLDGAKRKLREETGVSADFEYVCTARRILSKSGTLFSDVIFPVCYSESWSGTPMTTEYGENFWVEIDTAIQNDSERDDRIDAIATVLTAIRDDQLDTVRGQYYEQFAELG